MSDSPPRLKWLGAPVALLSAFLFGASTPLAKLLLGGVDPWMLAGLLYLGAGAGLGIAHWSRRLFGSVSGEAPLRRADLPWLAMVVLTGGVIGPALPMVGLKQTEASTAALLLNLEGLATMAIAWIVFRENVDRRLLLGAAAILAGAVLLSWQGELGGVSWGALAIMGACLAWGIDNNLTRKLSAADPVEIAMIKGFVAGAANLTLALLHGAVLPEVGAALGAGLVGFLGYGISVALFVLALRSLGTARTGAYFSTAPFIGAALAVAMFDEPVTPVMLAAAVLMGVGVCLHLTERHNHVHEHGELAHEHAHWHDEHHRHTHDPGDPPGEPHSHWHSHELVEHGHPHYPDLHHRHGH
jgi:drug/metabolite transporter (DMT)-like permease